MSSLRVHPRLKALMEGPHTQALQAGRIENGDVTQDGPQSRTAAGASDLAGHASDVGAFDTVKLQRPGESPVVFEGRLLITLKREGERSAGIPLHVLDIYETQDGSFVASLRQADGDWTERVLCVAEGDSIESVSATLKAVDPAERFAAHRLVTQIPEAENPALALKSLQAGIDALRYDLSQTLGLVADPVSPLATP